MRDDHHRAVALVEHLLEPADRVDVQVVGRLVEQEDVGIGEQGLGEQDPQFPTRRHFAHRAFMLLLCNADSRQQLAGARLGGVAVEFGEPRLQVGRPHIVVVGRVRVRIDPVALDASLPHLDMSHHDHVENTFVFIGELVLV